MKRTFALLTAVFILVCMPGAALAAQGVGADASADAVISPMFTYITYANCTLSISGGSADMEALISANPPINKIRITESLQRNEGGTWQTVASWSQNYYSNSASWTKSYSVTSGYEYRLYCTFYCYIDTTSAESTTRASYYTY